MGPTPGPFHCWYGIDDEKRKGKLPADFFREANYSPGEIRQGFLGLWSDTRCRKSFTSFRAISVVFVKDFFRDFRERFRDFRVGSASDPQKP